MSLLKDLQSIGLDEKEALTYIATLEIGKGTAQEISKKSKVNRPTTYFVLKRLAKWGLVTPQNQEKKQVFFPENPSQIKNILQQQEDALNKKKEGLDALIHKLESINAAKTDEPIVKYYLGKKEIIRMAKESFSKKKPGSQMWLAHSEDTLSKFLLQEERSSLKNKRLASKTPLLIIYSTQSGLPVNNKKGLCVACISEKEYPLPADIAIYDDKIRIASFEDDLGIII
ncbi:MAG: hypothetical protein EOM19_03325, partial [Candidatus Moranbacteria bacterium]|nr:hypothetical protein [Candidatus Moranbacteria bacterium]